MQSSRWSARRLRRGTRAATFARCSRLIPSQDVDRSFKWVQLKVAALPQYTLPRNIAFPTLTELAEELADLVGEELRLLEGGEVAT